MPKRSRCTRELWDCRKKPSALRIPLSPPASTNGLGDDHAKIVELRTDSDGDGQLDDPVVRGIVVNVRDITERNRINRALINEKERIQVTLESIGDGTADPTSGEVRRRARAESGYLRSLIDVARAPAGAREVLRDLVQRGHAAGLDVEVRGAAGALPLPPVGLRAALAALVPSDLSTAERLTITCAPIADGGTIIVTVPGAALDTPAASEAIRDRDGEGFDLHVEEMDGVWAEIAWPGSSVTERPVVSATEPAGSR